MSEESYSIEYQLSESEYLSACSENWKARGLGSKNNCIIGVIGVGCGLLGALTQDWPWLHVITGTSAILLILVWLRIIVHKRAYRESKKYSDTIKVTYDNSSMNVETIDGKSELKWTYFTAYLDTPEFILLYYTKHHFSSIPKCAFPDPASLQAFEENVKANMNLLGA